MLFPHIVVAAVALATKSIAQTPPNYPPSTNHTLDVIYNSHSVAADQFVPQSEVTGPPNISSITTLSANYIIALVDVSIPDADAPKPSTGLVRGLEQGRTTYVQWLQTDVTQHSNGRLNGPSSGEIASYSPPNPPSTDPMPHTYVLYLFNQPAHFGLPAADAGRNYSIGSSGRANFSVQAIANENGQPIAAVYFRVRAAGTSSTGDGNRVSGSSSGAMSLKCTVGGVLSIVAGLGIFAMLG